METIPHRPTLREIRAIQRGRLAIKRLPSDCSCAPSLHAMQNSGADKVASAATLGYPLSACRRAAQT